jgi:hypothetical protein
VKNGQAQQFIGHVPAPARQAVVGITRAAFTAGLDEILLVAGCIALVAGVVSLLAIRTRDFVQTGGEAAGGAG